MRCGHRPDILQAKKRGVPDPVMDRGARGANTMMPHMMYGMEGWWLLGMGLMVLFWVAVMVLVIWAVRSLFPREAAPKRDQALETLRARYAAGKIDAETYERARAALEETPVA